MPGIAAATADATGVAFGGSGTELLAAATTGVHGVDTSANEVGVNLSTEYLEWYGVDSGGTPTKPSVLEMLITGNTVPLHAFKDRIKF